MMQSDSGNEDESGRSGTAAAETGGSVTGGSVAGGSAAGGIRDRERPTRNYQGRAGGERGEYEAAAVLAACYGMADLAVLFARGEGRGGGSGGALLASAVMASQFNMMAVWVAFGSWPAAVRIGLAWGHAAFVFLLLEGGGSPRVVESGATIGFFTCLGAVPLRGIRLLGFELERETPAAGKDQGTEEGAAAGRRPPQKKWQFSTRDLLNWTAGAGLVIAMAGRLHLEREPMAFLVIAGGVLWLAVVFFAVAMLAPRTGLGVGLGVAVILFTPMLFAGELGRVFPLLILLAAVLAPLVFLRVCGIKFVNVLRGGGSEGGGGGGEIAVPKAADT